LKKSPESRATRVAVESRKVQGRGGRSEAADPPLDASHREVQARLARIARSPAASGLIGPQVALKSEFAQRRRQLMRLMGRDSIAILPAAPVRQRNNDVEYAYRQDSDFH